MMMLVESGYAPALPADLDARLRLSAPMLDDP